MFKGLLKQIMKKQRIHDFVYLNDPPNISHNCIYAVNHSCKWDFQYMVEIARKDFHILAGKQKLKLIDRIGFIWNGTVWVDRQDKKSKNHSKAKLLKLLQRGKTLLIFPEGTWNLTPSTLVLPLYWGIIELAQNEGVPIVPISLEYRENKCFVKHGNLIHIKQSDDKSQAIQNLRDVFATLKWEVLESFPMEKRSEVPKDFWDKQIQRRLDEYELLDYEYEMSCVRKGET